MPTERRLAAIMFTDVVGYTTLVGKSEETGHRVRQRHGELLRPRVERYHGLPSAKASKTGHLRERPPK